MRKVFTTPEFRNQHDFISTLRNQLREFTNNGVTMVVKAFCLPKFINRIVYGLLRSSKAQRSCE